MQPPSTGHEWLGVSGDPLPVDAALAWVGSDGCGAQVLFTGTVRDHAEGRSGVTGLSYEAYEEQVVPRLAAVADEARARWPDIGRIVMLHRIGELSLRDVAVVVVVAAPHRPEAFAAARFCIDALKASAPIWKKERWVGGEAWGTGAQPVETDLQEHGAR